MNRKVVRPGSDSSMLTILWAAYFCSVLTVGRYEEWTRWVIWGGAAVVTLVTLPFLTRRVREIPSEVVLIAAFLGWSLIAGVDAVNVDAYVGYFKLVVELLLLIALFGTVIRNSDSIQVVWWSLLVVSAFNTLYLLSAGSVELAGEANDLTERPAGLTGNPNALGFFCLLGILGGMGIFGRAKSQAIRVICAIAGGVAFYGLVAAESRGAYLMFVLAAILWTTIVMQKSGRGAWKSVIVASAIGFVFYGSMVWVQQSTRLGNRMTEALGGHLLKEKRYDLFVIGIEIIKDHPLIGVGLGQFGLASRTGLYAHSEWIELAATTGIPGFLLFMGVYYSSWRRMSRALLVIRDPADRYSINMARVMLIILVIAGAMFRPNFVSFDTMFVIAFVVGMGHWAERKGAAQASGELHAAPLSPSRAVVCLDRAAKRDIRALR